MKHTLTLAQLTKPTVRDSGYAEFDGKHQIAEYPRGFREPGTEPYGPFYVGLTAVMDAADWKAAGSPTAIEVDL